MSRAPVIGQIVWRKHGKNPPKVRPGVIVGFRGDDAIVAFGTTVCRQHDTLLAEQSATHRVGRKMGLAERTYFYVSDRVPVPSASLWQDDARMMAPSRLVQALAQ